MAGEIGALGVKILYAPEATAGVRPTSGYVTKASGATLNIADFVTAVAGLTSDIDKGDVTPISEPQYGRRRFIPLLYGNDGSIKFTCNINKISRDDWNAIVDQHNALTGGKSIWWEIILPGDDKGYFFRGEPCPMMMPDFSAGEVVQGDVEIIESDNEDYQTKVDVASA